MTTLIDFNDAAIQPTFDLIPKGTIAPVRMTLRPGGYDDAAQGWTGGYATQSATTGSIYLAAEFVVLDGPYARRKIWSVIGLHSPKGQAWGRMGASFIRSVLGSARGFAPKDDSPAALSARRIANFGELDGIEFLAQIDHEKDQHGEWKNVVARAIEPGHPSYVAPIAGQVASTSTRVLPSVAPKSMAAPATPAARPAWAQ